jgi:very-short-patch-repair endonuclease
MDNPIGRARALRSSNNNVERIFWSRVRDRRLEGFKFRRQVWIGNYIVDFVCAEKRLIVELDGGQHATAKTYDERRTLELEQLGYRVVRYWNSELTNNLEGVLADLLKQLRR